MFDVMVYFHGGGWLAGTGTIVGPQFLLDHDLVLVTVNYRLGPIGKFAMYMRGQGENFYPSQQPMGNSGQEAVG